MHHLWVVKNKRKFLTVVFKSGRGRSFDLKNFGILAKQALTRGGRKGFDFILETHKDNKSDNIDDWSEFRISSADTNIMKNQLLQPNRQFFQTELE